MKTLLRACVLLVLGLLGPVLARAQTVVVSLTFDDSDNRLEQTGSADTTFAPANGAVTFATGFDGGTAAVFDGESSLQASDTPLFSALTVAFWMKTTTDNGLAGGQWYQGAGLVDGELAGDTNDWGLSQLGTHVAFGIGASDRTIFSTSSVNTGEWIHVAATWDTSGNMSLYLNGQLETTYGGGSTVPRNTSNQFYIGQDLSGNSFTGSLDQIQIFDSVLSAGQIASLAAVPEPATYASLLGGGILCLVMSRWRRGRKRPVA